MDENKLKDIESVKSDYENKFIELKKTNVDCESRLFRERDDIITQLKSTFEDKLN